MKKYYTLSFTILFALCCLFKAKAQQYIWTQKANYGGAASAAVAGFSIGNKGYFCGGLNSSNVAQKDVWEYDPGNDTWTQKADAGTLTRYSATGFSIGNKGYLCLGWELIGQNALNDLWEFDPVQNSWSAKSNFSGSARYLAVAFVVNNKAYVGLGYGPVQDDFYEYDPFNDTWTVLTNVFPGGARTSARAFSITYTILGTTYEKGYVTAGSLNPNANTQLANDLWEFTPGSTAGSGTWMAKTNFPGSPRFAPFAFALTNKGYVGGGLGTGQTIYNDFFEYDPVTNSWTPRTAFPGMNKIGAKTFVIGNKAYVGTGQDLSVYYPEFYEYGPDATALPEHFNSNQIQVYTINGNQVRFNFSDLSNLQCTVKIYSIEGKLLKDIENLKVLKFVDVAFEDNPQGIYSYLIYSENKLLKSGKFYFN